MNTSATNLTRELNLTHVSYRLMVIYVVIGFLLNFNPLNYPGSSIHPITHNNASKNYEKLQAVHQDFGNRFLKENISKASWVSVDNGFSLPIVQQPTGESSYVSTKLDLITQFSTPAENGVTGLLAHNYLSGKEFYSLQIGQVINVKYGGNILRKYEVVSINQFQKLDPTTIYSNLVDLETNKEYSSTEVFNRFYKGSHHLVFQTCLGKDGRLDWGLIFIVAKPVDRHQ